mmetsp:Transcript_150695/g.383198  ORF Transcript_150695/g.383198 Transcript_150695/m.383198 type:complete len:255 (+) Transcript_150695:470-1234(+)
MVQDTTGPCGQACSFESLSVVLLGHTSVAACVQGTSMAHTNASPLLASCRFWCSCPRTEQGAHKQGERSRCFEFHSRSRHCHDFVPSAGAWLARSKAPNREGLPHNRVQALPCSAPPGSTSFRCTLCSATLPCQLVPSNNGLAKSLGTVDVNEQRLQPPAQVLYSFFRSFGRCACQKLVTATCLPSLHALWRLSEVSVKAWETGRMIKEHICHHSLAVNPTCYVLSIRMPLLHRMPLQATSLQFRRYRRRCRRC